MKRAKIIISIILTALTFSSQAQSQDLMAEFSLFYEYQKNNDFKSALPHGWKVIEENPEPFLRYNIFTKMESALFYMHDSVATTEEEKSEIADTTLYLYEKAMKYEPDKSGYYLKKKAFVLESWTDTSAEELIAAYEKALEANPDLEDYYKDRYGMLLTNNADSNPDYKLRALDLYSSMSEGDPTNETWVSRIENLAENPDELVEITYKAWQLDPDNMEKAWKYASTAMRNQNYEKAVEPLQFLVEKGPEVINYWNQLATAYQKQDNYSKALEAYKKLTELQPDNAEHFVNLALMYKNQGQLAAARSYLNKAADVNPNWDYPHYIEATLYEQAARNCGYEFMDKIVYQLAVNTYRTALSKGGQYASSARDRISALANSVPSQEDYFFRNINSGDKIKIEGGCYDWINRTVTVP
ncbi:MAG: tetratricopeptide repeat protein [Melioribacteraceae bacterium]|nr:tetratricopeptide repeat protein [Melioribacteraceae bacterium]